MQAMREQSRYVTGGTGGRESREMCAKRFVWSGQVLYRCSGGENWEMDGHNSVTCRSWETRRNG